MLLEYSFLAIVVITCSLIYYLLRRHQHFLGVEFAQFEKTHIRSIASGFFR